MVLGDSFSKLLTSLAPGICEVGVSSIIIVGRVLKLFARLVLSPFVKFSDH